MCGKFKLAEERTAPPPNGRGSGAFIWSPLFQTVPFFCFYYVPSYATENYPLAHYLS
jgi:hypothetical protein